MSGVKDIEMQGAEALAAVIAVGASAYITATNPRLARALLAAHVHAAEKAEQADNDLLRNSGISAVDGNRGQDAENRDDQKQGEVGRAGALGGTFLVESLPLGFGGLPDVDQRAGGVDDFFVVRRDGFSLVVKNTIAARFLSLFGLVHVRSLSDARNVAELGD